MSNYTKEEFTEEHGTADKAIGSIHITCSLLGTPANLVALSYFLIGRRSQRFRNVTSVLYVLTALQDCLICLLSLNHGVTLLRGRDVWLPKFCPILHILFQMSQRMSVFLVAALSFTRTFTLLYPLRKVSKSTILTILGAALMTMTCVYVIPYCLKVTEIRYHWQDGYCWITPFPGNEAAVIWIKVDTTLDAVVLAFPIIPITISCGISSYQILNTRKNTAGLTAADKATQDGLRRREQRLTLTIILVTILYIAYNIPLFINYVLYQITLQKFTWPGPLYSSLVMRYYIWNLTALLGTALNATSNPVLYWIRFTGFRKWVTRKFIRSVVSSGGSSTNQLGNTGL